MTTNRNKHLASRGHKASAADILREAFTAETSVLIDAPPGIGKTTSVPKVVNQTNLPSTYLTERIDLYEQMEQLAEENNLSHAQIPVPHRECPTFENQYGNELQNEANQLYNRGVYARRLHHELDLPCNDTCPYLAQWETIQNETYDLLIGHYSHAHVTPVIEKRVVIFDEFAEDAFITHIEKPGQIISTFLNDYPELGYSDYTDFINNRSPSWTAVAINQFGVPIEPDPRQAMDHRNGHSLAPILTLGLALAKDMENGWESSHYSPAFQIGTDPKTNTPVFNTRMDEPWWPTNFNYRVVRNRNSGEVWILSPPNLSNSLAVIGLDGTPTKTMWDTAFNMDFTHEKVLSHKEFAQYISSDLNIDIQQINHHIKPYQNRTGRNVTPSKDTKFAYWIMLREGRKPTLITSKQAIREYESHKDGEIFNYLNDHLTFGNVRSNNAFSDIQLGLICGSRHYGDSYIKRWGAFRGRPVEDNGKRGIERAYGDFGNSILNHMRIETLQDVMRFGRNQKPTTVYVNTGVLPDWVPKFEPDEWIKIGKSSRRIINEIREAGNKGMTVNELSQSLLKSPETIRQNLESIYDKTDFIEKYPRRGNDPTIYAME